MTESAEQRIKNEHEARAAFEVHRKMVVALFVATVVVCVILTLGLLVAKVTVLMAVTLAGALGGFVSALRRLYAFERVFPSDFLSSWSFRNSFYVSVYALVPPLVGAIAADVVYLIFAGGFITGDLFPRFVETGQPSENRFNDFVQHWAPEPNQGYAKVLVWGFIAGFSERFVPDMLERFAAGTRAERGSANED